MTLDDDLDMYFRPHYTDMLFRIQDIKDRAKTAILQLLADGQWHTQMDLLRVARRTRFIGEVGFGYLMQQFQEMLAKDFITHASGPGDETLYKIQDNYVGLTRAAYYKYDIKV